MSTRSQLAKRAFVKVLLALAAAYGLELHLYRDSGDDAVSAAYSRVMKRVHPDKGGAVADARRLQIAKEEWEGPKRGSAGGRAGGPPCCCLRLVVLNLVQATWENRTV